MRKAENLNFQSPAFLPFFTILKVVCQCHRKHSLNGQEIWFKGERVERDRAIRLGQYQILFHPKRQRDSGEFQPKPLTQSEPKEPCKASKPYRVAGQFHFSWLKQVDRECWTRAPNSVTLPPQLSFPFCQAGSSVTKPDLSKPFQHKNSGPVHFDVSVPTVTKCFPLGIHPRQN